MSEKLHSPEHHELMKVPDEALVEQHSKPEKQPTQNSSEKYERQKRNLEHLKQQAESYAASGEKVAANQEQENKSSREHIGQNQVAKAENYEKILDELQAKHGPLGRGFSRFIHKPSVDKASELAGRTVARPSAILGGALAGLIGSGILFFTAKNYGFEYNFFVFIGLFMLGYFLGVIIEFLLRALRHPGPH